MADIDASLDHARCANNCGYYANPGTGNLCSKCFKESIKASKAKKIEGGGGKILHPDVANVKVGGSGAGEVEISVAEAEIGPEAKADPNRCILCSKKITLSMVFKCRCELVFCAKHRHPEDHSCHYDYRDKGRKDISKANPVIKAEKITKI
ncbi:hypothetical protein SELMODRAFT_91519 [Selaginella moellendorffii]|uniref:AN1-type domain-containing protein n=1 Tax=Selaginella moellendorffii TaxID=88036 RepID=D8REN0_SELML|nr:hypothetical protein SELMODRAFT_91519 [Selaginella moellendorffii]